MFIVGDGDASDADNDIDIEDRNMATNEDIENGSAESAKVETPTDEVEHQFDVLDKAMEDRKRARRYHALLELLTTEVGYLMDLRALVSVCVPPAWLASLANYSLASPPDISNPAFDAGCARPFLTFAPFYFSPVDT